MSPFPAPRDYHRLENGGGREGVASPQILSTVSPGHYGCAVGVERGQGGDHESEKWATRKK